MNKIYQTTVFSHGSNGGNPCPVMLNCDALTKDQMQEITKQAGFESVFVKSSNDPACSFQLCYFVPEHEMEMCVHATIAATTVLYQKGMIKAGFTWYQTLLGKIKVSAAPDDAGLLVQVWQFLPSYQEDAPSMEELCRCLHLSSDDIGDTSMQSVSTSRYKLLIPLKSRKQLDQLSPDYPLLQQLCIKYHTTGFYPFAISNENEKESFHARQFPANSGYPEDAATGVAASALGVYALEKNLMHASDGWNDLVIYQGEAMHRPSKILSRIRTEQGAITEVTVCGYASLSCRT